MRALTRTATILLLGATLTANAVAGGPGGQSLHGPGRHGASARHDGDWIAPLIFLGIAGAIIAAAASDDTPRPAYAPAPGYAYPPGYAHPPAYAQGPAYVPGYAPPAATGWSPPVPPPDAGYWCGSAGLYYPSTRYCPEGWQMVQPR